MWARISELILAGWLLISLFLFSHGDHLLGWTDFATPFAIALLAALSFVNRLNKMHLLQSIPAGLLLYVSYSYPTPWLPFGLQNYILTALFLLVFMVIPSHAFDAPRPWKKFHSKE